MLSRTAIVRDVPAPTIASLEIHLFGKPAMPGFALFTVLYLVAVNFAGFVMMRADKVRARRGEWRIPEEDLFAVAAIGGSVGVLIGMYAFRHKTLHKRFVFGIPAIMVVQLAVGALLVWRLAA